MKHFIPKTYYVYEFSYPPEMPELAGIVFYVGKGTSLSRMNNHFTEASNGCDCNKCQAIRSVCSAGFIVVRRIMFESTDERLVLQEEASRIKQHRSPHLTNIVGIREKQRAPTPAPKRGEKQALQHVTLTRIEKKIRCRRCRQPGATVEDRFCQLCWDKILTECRQDWKHIPMTEQELWDLAQDIARCY